jgi:hypothetical protein
MVSAPTAPGAPEPDLDRHPRAELGLGGVLPDVNDDLKGAARRVDGRADELNDSRRAHFGETIQGHLDRIAPAHRQQLLLRQVDAGQEGLGGRDLEERLVSVLDHLLADAGVFLGHDTGERRANHGVVEQCLGLFPPRHGDLVLRFLHIEVRRGEDPARRKRLGPLELDARQLHLILRLMLVLLELPRVEPRDRLVFRDHRSAVHEDVLDDARDPGGDRHLLVDHEVGGIDLLVRGRRQPERAQTESQNGHARGLHGSTSF